MSYRKKTCPYCSKEHKLRGPFCSKTCSNKNRRHSDETKEKIRIGAVVAQNKPEQLDATWALRTRGQLTLAAIIKKVNPQDVETDPDNLYLPPMIPHEGTLASGDLWFDVD
jgi:hypothetical protein